MAGAAATQNLEIEQLEYDLKFQDITAVLGDVFPGYERPPEQEVYGRSLSTIHRLGALMVDGAAPEVIKSPEAAQVKAEFYTSVEEGFGTDVELGGGLEVRDFDSRQIIQGKVMSKDLKTAVSSMTEAGLICAQETARADKQFLPQLTRSRWDHQNALIVDAMARGETDYNTRIVVSPFPEEAAARSGDAYWRRIGYVPKRKRGFVQMFHADDTVLTAGSLSFDGSNKRRLHETFRRFGKEIPEGEITDNWLSHAITGTFSLEEAKALATALADEAGDPEYQKTTNTVEVTRKYGEVMNRVFESSYVHICESLYKGQQTKEAAGLILQLTHQAKYFNDRYSKALYRMRANQQEFTDDDAAVLHDLLVYSTIEMMRALHLGEANVETLVPAKTTSLSNSRYYGVSHSDFQAMLGGLGAEGARQGRSVSACGLEIAPGQGGPGNPQTAFGAGVSSAEAGGIEDAGEDMYGSLEFYCKNGHWNVRPRNTLICECRFKDCKNSVKC